MRAIEQLDTGFPDAENYRRREFKDRFNRIFFRDNKLEQLKKPEISFLIGEKGTGKTAYAVYLSNNFSDNTYSDLKFIRETDYKKFVYMKNKDNLDLSDYSNIWKVMVYLILSQSIINKESNILTKYFKFNNLNAAINEYYQHAFSPEIINALDFVQQTSHVIDLMVKHANISSEFDKSVSTRESSFQVKLFYIQRQFENSFSELKLESNHTLFIDGIDIRPSGIAYNDYLDCIKGLSNAIWQINNDFFPSIRDSPGRLKVVLLMRPDIFATMGLQNQNIKFRSNSVYLDWRTTYENHRTSEIFAIIDKLLLTQQSKKYMSTAKLGDTWDYYFPFHASTSSVAGGVDPSFIKFLRYSLYRPRDIIMMVEFMKEGVSQKHREGQRQFVGSDFTSPQFLSKLADYLLGEIKDQIGFYYSSQEYKVFLSFFMFLHGRTRFSYDEYLTAYDEVKKYTVEKKVNIPSFLESPNTLLQFLYELNVICYVEDVVDHQPFIHWCFRDRSYSKLSPQVKPGVRYEIFYGLGRAINTGKEAQKITIR